jgi:hypothetical protein
MAKRAGGLEVWAHRTWVLVLDGDELSWRDFGTFEAADKAAAALEAGDDARTALGWVRKRLALSAVRAVEWVEGANVLLVRGPWWAGPWRLACSNAELGWAVFDRLAEALGGGEAEKARVGPNDLAMDPKFGLGVLLAFLGVVAVVLGAIEGAGGPVQGPAARFRPLAEFGEAIGPTAAFAVGVLALLAGVGALVWWYRNRPTKLVIRRR